MFKQRVILQGDRALLRQLSFLRKRVATRIIKSAITSAASLALKAAKAKVPVRLGQLKRSLGKKAKAYPKKGVFVVVIGPRSGFKIMDKGKPVNPTQYAHLVELGTQHSEPKPFMRPAFDETRDAMIALAQQKMREGILREALKRD